MKNTQSINLKLPDDGVIKTGEQLLSVARLFTRDTHVSPRHIDPNDLEGVLKFYLEHHRKWYIDEKERVSRKLKEVEKDSEGREEPQAFKERDTAILNIERGPIYTSKYEILKGAWNLATHDTIYSKDEIWDIKGKPGFTFHFETPIKVTTVIFDVFDYADAYDLQIFDEGDDISSYRTVYNSYRFAILNAVNLYEPTNIYRYMEILAWFIYSFIRTYSVEYKCDGGFNDTGIYRYSFKTSFNPFHVIPICVKALRTVSNIFGKYNAIVEAMIDISDYICQLALFDENSEDIPLSSPITVKTPFGEFTV